MQKSGRGGVNVPIYEAWGIYHIGEVMSKHHEFWYRVGDKWYRDDGAWDKGMSALVTFYREGKVERMAICKAFLLCGFHCCPFYRPSMTRAVTIECGFGKGEEGVVEVDETQGHK